MEIKHALSKQQADELFAAESVFMYYCDAVPEYRMIELFGEAFVKWIDKCDRYDGYLKRGDVGHCLDRGRILRWFYRPGFDKVVSTFNIDYLERAHENSVAGKLIDAAWGGHKKEIARMDAAEGKSQKVGRKEKQAESAAEQEATK